MHDQVRSAEAAGIRAAALTSADDNRDETPPPLPLGRARPPLCGSPSGRRADAFRGLLGDVPLSLIAIDEAHCVSEWGHDFRPDYRLLGPLLAQFAGGAPASALTATADRHTRADIPPSSTFPTTG